MASGPLPARVGDGTARLVNRVAVAYVHAEPFPMLPLLAACGTVTAPSPSQPASTHSGPDQLLHGHSQVERQPGDVDDATRRSPGPGLYSGRHQSSVVTPATISTTICKSGALISQACFLYLAGGRSPRRFHRPPQRRPDESLNGRSSFFAELIPAACALHCRPRRSPMV